MKKHATLSASKSERWINCPGSIRLEADAPAQKTSIYAAEGTAAHSLAETCLKEKKTADHYLNASFDGNTVGHDMIDAVNVYLKVIADFQKQFCTDDLSIEKRFDLSWLHPNLFGTNDASIYSEMFSHLIVLDYKHGRGVSVDVIDNPQLVYYALGSFQEWKKKGKEIETIEMVIVQPRAEHPDGRVRSWVISKEELKEWSQKIKAAAIATEAPDAPLNAGDWCKWCPAAGFCDALQSKALTVAQAEFSKKEIKLPDPKTLAVENLVKVLSHADLISSWLNQVHAHAQNLLELGNAIPGFKLVRRDTHRKWKNTEAVEKVFHKMVGEALFKKTFITPAQLEKIVGKEMVEGLWEKPEGEKVLAPESDPRPALVELTIIND